MTNVLFIDSGTGWGGSSSFLYNLLKRLNKQRFNPIVSLYNFGDGPYLSKIKDMGIKVIFLKNSPKQNKEKEIKTKFLRKAINYSIFLSNFIKNDVPAVLKIVKVIKQFDIKLVFLNNDLHFHVPAVLGAKFSGVRCIGRKSGIGGGEKIKRLLSRFVDIFIANSEASAADYIKGGLPKQKIVTIYTGIDLESYRPYEYNGNMRSAFGIKPDSLVVCSISRFDHGKGHDDLIEAARLVAQKIPGVVFLIVGNDIVPGECMKEQLEHKVKSLGIENNVIFSGWRDDIVEILRGVNVFVHCPNTWQETLSIATLEAVACGKPAVVTRNGGNPEIIKDGFNGFVVPVGDHRMIAEKVLAILGDKQLLNRLSENSRKFAEQNFDVSRNVIKFEQIFETVLNKA